MAIQLDSALPDGHPTLLPHAAYRKDEVGGWTWGGSPLFTAELQAKLETAVRERKTAFAYSMQELPGYTGDIYLFLTSAQLRSRCDVWLAIKASL